MKKLFFILTACGILISVCGCGTGSNKGNEEDTSNDSFIYVSPADGISGAYGAYVVRNSAEV